jgi:hypothetical protein
MDFLAIQDSRTGGQVSVFARMQVRASSSNRLIFRASRLNMSAPAGVSGTRLAGKCGG